MRWLVRIVVVLVIALLAAGVGILMLPGERIARIAADQLRAQTGRELAINGEVSVTYWPVLGVRTGPVTFSNADWAGPEPMLRAQALTIGVAAADLLTGSIRVTEITASSPALRLERNADGRGNWEFGKAAAATEPATETAKPADVATGKTPLTLERLRLTDASLVYVDKGAAPVTLNAVDLALDWPDAAAPAEIMATLRPAGEAIDISARVDGFANLLDGKVTPMTARITAPGGELEFDGRASTAGEAAGQVELVAKDTGRMLAALGFPGSAPPRGLGRAVDMTAQATYTADGRLTFRDLILDLDGNALSGAADIQLGGVPQITARLEAGMINFSSLGGGGGAGSETAGAATSAGWSKDQIDASALALANGSVKFSADAIRTGTVDLGRTHGVLRLENSRAVLDLAQVSVFGGSLSGKLIANNRRGFSVAGDLKAETIEMKEVLLTLAGIDRLTGNAGGSLEFLGAGGSVDAIMRSLKGAGKLAMGQGVIHGINLDQLMRSGQAKGGTTVFDSLTASFTMAAGNLQNEDLLVQLKNFRADGAGRIGLGGRDIDYLFTPVALRVNSGEGLAIPIRIKGPWSGPSIVPDLTAALKSAADVKLEELEVQAKDKVNQKLQEELGVTVKDGQKTEDALQDKLEDEAKKGLLKLLGSN